MTLSFNGPAAVQPGVGFCAAHWDHDNYSDREGFTAPADTAIGPPTATARRLVDASVSTNTRRAYAALEPISTWTL